MSIDGDLKEWEELPFKIINPSQIYKDRVTWTGREDTSLKFGFSQDKDFSLHSI